MQLWELYKELYESKKVKIYTDILLVINAKEKAAQDKAKKLDDKDLLNVVEGDFGN